MAKISEIEGIGPSYAEKLTAADISTTEKLLKVCGSKKGRAEIAMKTGISESNLLKWSNMADLMRIKGVGKQFAELLEAAGVDTVKELRTRTGAGMMDCKRALQEVDGNIDEAIKYLRTKGLAAAAKKAHRKANDGCVVVAGDSARMAMIELNCETEPVSKLDDFRSFAEALAAQALAAKADDVAVLMGQPFAEARLLRLGAAVEAALR